MKKENKKRFLEMESTGYFSGFGGLEVKSIMHGVNDIVVFAVGAWTGSPEIHTARIHYETERAFFNYKGIRVHFDEVLKM